MPQRNERLARAMSDARISNKALARAVRELSERRGAPIGCDHTSVSRWLSGTRPRGAAPDYIAEVLSSRIGRPVSLVDIGMSAADQVPATLGLVYEESPEQAVDSIGKLWRADLDQVRAIADAPMHAGAGGEAALAWLVRGEDVPQRSRGTRVGASDIAVARATVDTFAALDNRYGGGQAREALIQYLASHMT